MFAGKTTELLSRLAAARAAGRRVVAVQPAGDTRSGSGRLMAHTGQTWEATPLAGAGELAEAAGKAEVVGIDEVHFFGADLADACRELAGRGVRVIAAGVDLDHRGNVFPAVGALRLVAREVMQLVATCARCGAAATHTQRLVDSDAPIVVGGVEAYEPRCAACFQPPAVN